MKKILFFTGNRAEFGLQVPIINEIKKTKKFKYGIIVSGSHLDKNYGKTLQEIEEKKYNIIGKIKIYSKQDILYTPKNISLITNQVSIIIKNFKPDIFISYADRFETFAATIAASMMNICVAHIEGGDITNGGTFDDNIRHAITKLSHIHFTSTADAKKNVIKLGEEKNRVFNVGFSGIDNIKNLHFGTASYLIKKYNLDFNKQTILFTYHPLTSDYKSNINNLKSPIRVLKKLNYTHNIIITFPNNDLGSDEIISFIKNSVNKKTNIKVFKSLGSFDYLTFMSLCLKNSRSLIVLGNSSSAIKETMSFKCPVINILPRQEGRVKGSNVIDVISNDIQIMKAIKKINNDNNFIKKVRNSKNIYGDGNSSKKIVNILEKINLNKKLLIKKHYESK